jgi:hypothetical protein
MNVHWMVLYKLYVFCSDMKFKMAATAGLGQLKPGWWMASPDTILKLDTLVMIQTKFGFHWSSTFRGEDF